MADDENKDATPEENVDGAPEAEATPEAEAPAADAAPAGEASAEEEEMDDETKAFLEAGKKDEEAKAKAAAEAAGETAGEAASAGEAGSDAEEEMDDATKAFLEAGKVDEEAKAAAAAGAAPAPAAAPAEKEKPEADVQSVAFSNLTGQGVGNVANMDMILDIPVTVSVELGKTRILINELLSLGQGSVVELNKLAGEPMEIMVNGKLIARGEVVVVNEKFGVRLTDIISVTERISQLG